MIYLVIFFVVYVAPLGITAFVALLLAKTVFSRMGWGVALSVSVAVLASCVPWGLDRLGLSRSLAAFTPDIIYPDQLTLPAGALWHLEEGNDAGITCGYLCELETLPFVTELGYENVGYALQSGGSGKPLNQHDLWQGLFDYSRQDGEDFPYQYAYISLPIYRDYGVPQEIPYRKPHWPEDGKGVHLLVALPRHGILDFAQAEVFYRRYNIQRNLALPFLWGIGRHTVQAPTSASILQDLRAIVKVE